jgi:hypothetical protein
MPTMNRQVRAAALAAMAPFHDALIGRTKLIQSFYQQDALMYAALKLSAQRCNPSPTSCHSTILWVLFALSALCAVMGMHSFP